MAAIGKVSAVFTASTSGLTSGVAAASASLKRMEAGIGSLRNGMTGLVAIQGAQLFASLVSGATQAARQFIAMGQAQAEVIDGQSKLAARLGMTYAELSGLTLAGELAGVSMESIGTAVTKADVAFVRAAEGSATAIAAFQGIGLSLDQLQGLTAADRFDAIAQAISELPTEAQRAEAAIQLFGRAGAQLLPLFAGGAAGIAEARAEAQRFGLALSNVQGQNVEAMNDAFTRAQQAVAGVIQQVVAYLAPAVESVTTAFSDLIGNVGGATIGQTIGDGILVGAKFLAEIADTVIANFSSVFNYLSQVGGQWSAVWDIASRVGALFSGVGRVLQASFLGVVGIFSGIASLILKAVRSAADALGFDTAGLDTAIASLTGFNQQLSADMTSALDAAGENFSAVFAESGQTAGEAIAGPITTSIDQAIAAAREAAGQVDVSTTTTVDQKVKIDSTSLNQAVKGVDSRSKEGVDLMLQLMRGDAGATIQERIAKAAEQTADNTRDFGVEFDEMDLAPAAGR